MIVDLINDVISPIAEVRAHQPLSRSLRYFVSTDVDTRCLDLFITVGTVGYVVTCNIPVYETFEVPGKSRKPGIFPPFKIKVSP